VRTANPDFVFDEVSINLKTKGITFGPANSINRWIARPERHLAFIHYTIAHCFVSVLNVSGKV
jgi:hypothetical protein